MSTPKSRAVVLEPGGGERITVGASSLSIKAETATTGGTVFISETTIEPGFPGPPPHVHDRLHDMFYVLEGTLTFLVEARRSRRSRARSCACRPAPSTPSPTAATHPCASST